jgi:pimeloyl-ACP methyl ester carboxylesterase
MGAETVLLAASSFPGLARAAILEDPPFRQPLSPEEEERFKSHVGQMVQVMARQKSMTREELILLARQQNPTWPEDELGPWADSKIRVSQAFVESFQNRGLLLPSPWEALAKVACPMLLVTADPARGAIISPEIAQKAAQVLPTLKVAQIPGAGHNIRRENFNAYMQAVNGFLQAL